MGVVEFRSHIGDIQGEFAGFDEADALDASESDALPQAASRQMSMANVNKKLCFFIWYLRITIARALVVLQSWK